MTDTCMICRKPTPPGHVAIRNRKGKIVGRICSSHTLMETILDPMERFDVEVIFSPFGSSTNED